MSKVEPEVLDNDTLEVLKEMKDEGLEVDHPALKGEPNNPKPKDEPAADPDGDEPEGEDDDKPEDKEKPKDEPKDKPTPPDKPKEEPKDKEKPEDNPPRKPRSVKMVPAWELEKTKNQALQREKELLAEIEKSKQKPTPDNDTRPPEPDKKPPQNEKLKEVADKLGLNVETVSELIQIARDGQTANIPPEIQELAKLAPKLKEFQERQEREFNETQEMAEFNKEFERDVLPLVKAEYPDITPDKVDDIKKQLSEVAFTEEYVKLGLSKIYKAEDEFRGLVAPKPKSAEPGRGGAGRSDKVLDFDNMSEEDIANLSEEELDQFHQHQLKKEGQ